MLLLKRYLLNLGDIHMLRKSIFWSFFLFVFSCGNTVHRTKIVFLSKTKIAVPEPSGLAYCNGFLYTVSDRVSELYRLNLNGIVEEEYSVPVKDLEGVAYSASKNCFYLISESKRTLNSWSLEKGFLKKHKVKGEQHGGKNKGLEGLCYNSKNNSLYAVNEAKPKQLLKLSSKGKIQEKYKLDFAKDISGIVYDAVLNVFWMLSDASQALYKVSLTGEMIQKFPLGIEKPEGIALDENRKLYIVSDLTSELVVFQIQ